MLLKFGFATDIGKKRSQNQDNLAVFPEMGLFIVADGMGGHRGGETASAMAVELIGKSVRAQLAVPHTMSPHAAEILDQAMRHANTTIYRHALEHAELEGMGTTTTTLYFEQQSNVLWIGHVGDSRCYLLRPNCLWQLTRDHSLVQERLRAGMITREQAKTDQMRNVITRSVGFEPVVDVELYEVPVRENDLYLICSDGLSGLVPNDQILDIVQSRIFDAKSDSSNTNQNLDQNAYTDVAKTLINAANNNGGDDNVTLVMIHVK